MAVKLIVGLGNPGDQYINTRHNIGFKFIDALIAASDGDVSKKVALHSHLFQIRINGQKIICIKPQTYMNLSGVAVQAVMNFYKIPLNEVCIVTDDLDIDFGMVRVRQQGGAGTHNGMKSVIQVLGTQQVTRLRLGIGPKPDVMDSKDFVLQAFYDTEAAVLGPVLNSIRDTFVTYLNDSMALLMNRMNGRDFLN